MVDLDEIRSLQDYTGMLYAGAVLAWTDQANRDPQDIGPEDFETYFSWVEQEQIRFSVNSQRDFKRVLGYIRDPEWDNSEAHDLSLQVQDSEKY